MLPPPCWPCVGIFRAVHALLLDGVYRTAEGVPVFHAVRTPLPESCRPYSAGS